MLTINQIGYNFTENKKFVIDRPSGSGDFLLLYFITEVDVLMDTEMTTVQPFSVLIFSPSHIQFYSNNRTGFINDWIHFTGPGAAGILKKLDLPLNKPFLSEASHDIRDSIQDMEKEFRSKEPFYQYDLDASLQKLLVKLARWRRHQKHLEQSTHMTHAYNHLRRVRSQILTQYSNDWRLEDMARLANLSRSRFCYLYKNFFQTSPMKDLAVERFTLARHLLETTGSSVQEIAQRVGYPDLCHFSKRYKAIHGISPGKSRNPHELE